MRCQSFYLFIYFISRRRAPDYCYVSSVRCVCSALWAGWRADTPAACAPAARSCAITSISQRRGDWYGRRYLGGDPYGRRQSDADGITATLVLMRSSLGLMSDRMTVGDWPHGSQPDSQLERHRDIYVQHVYIPQMHITKNAQRSFFGFVLLFFICCRLSVSPYTSGSVLIDSYTWTQTFAYRILPEVTECASNRCLLPRSGPYAVAARPDIS